MRERAAKLYVALVHWPVYNREGEVVATSVTPLDVHDLGRLALTYGVAGYYITNPYPSQQQLVNEILRHWREGIGAEYSPQRREALRHAQVVAAAADAYDDVARREGQEPFVVATTARTISAPTIPADGLWKTTGTKPALLLFGTGFGLTDDLLYAADAVLEPIAAAAPFNHLPVRAAMAIYLDRIYGSP